MLYILWSPIQICFGRTFHKFTRFYCQVIEFDKDQVV